MHPLRTYTHPLPCMSAAPCLHVHGGTASTDARQQGRGQEQLYYRRISPHALQACLARPSFAPMTDSRSRHHTGKSHGRGQTHKRLFPTPNHPSAAPSRCRARSVCVLLLPSDPSQTVACSSSCHQRQVRPARLLLNGYQPCVCARMQNAEVT